MNRIARGFSLMELLVALVIFSAMSALAYGALSGVARMRTELARQQDDFAQLTRAVSIFERDLRQVAARPIRDNYGVPKPALIGTVDHIEFTRFGFANPQSEARSNLERVLYEFDDKKIKRGTFAVLDRAPGTAPQLIDLRSNVKSLQLRYLDNKGRWLDSWPAQDSTALQDLPRAIEFRIATSEMGEISRLIEMPSSTPITAPSSGINGGGATPTPIPLPVLGGK